jgi:hypothetical protein
MDYIPDPGITAEGCRANWIEEVMQCNDCDAKDYKKTIGKLD